METDAAGDVSGDVRTHRTGSAFYAIVHAASPDETVLTLFGKPTLEGADMCSDADALLRRFAYSCKDTSVDDDAVLPLLRGREEADSVRGVLVEVERGVAHK